MEDREESVASSTDFYGSEQLPDTPAPEPQNDAPPAKRKAEEVEPAPDKKRKLDSSLPPASTTTLNSCAGLPPAVWQHIFLSCSLTDLGRLLQINRSFHSYLTQVRTVSAKPDSGFLRLLKSESIWASVRNAHSTKPPKPLPGFDEVQMWQLVWSTKCQFCKKEGSFTPGEKIWQKGPGTTGVRVVWPFGVRSCGPCLLDRCQTDASLLFSSASALRPALPFAFVTNDQNYIPAYTLQAATTPANVEIVKYYYKEHAQNVEKELEQALTLGPAAVEEWFKGLDTRGKERMKFAENWERWEVKYQWWKEHQEPKQATPAAPSPASTSTQLSRKSPLQQAPSPVIHAPIPASKYRSIHSVARQEDALSHPSSIQTPAPTLTYPPPASHHVQTRPPTIPPVVYTPGIIPTGSTQPRGERNLHDANEAKANRKLEIERRCQLLNPPIPPNVLRHMDSFKAAIQISQPMNDYAWSMLEPRLIAQFPAAQQAESDHTSRIASLTTRATDRRQQDASLKEVKEVMDREWEESQRPVRERLSAIADDFINQDWDHGRAVTYENSPKFAVDLLMHVRRVFYAELGESATTNIQKDTDSLDGSDSRRPKLVLENMKWVYDNKLKPLTEQFRKELFLCYGNGCEVNTRFYGFEGVIQHFGAKHTNTFSVGNVVVAWREAEWPEETPFHPDPISVKNAFHSGSNMANQGTSGYGSYYGGYSRAGTSTPHMQPHLPQASPGPYGYGNQYNGPFAPPHVSSQATSGYDYTVYAPSADPYSTYPPMGPPGYGGQANNNGYVASPAISSAAIIPSLVTQSQAPGTTEANNPGNGEYRTSSYDKQVSTIIEVAQDIWKQTTGIKDLPNSLRIYVLLHRVISKFHIEFNHEPNLNHVVDAFSNHEIPRALKNAPGLCCKACQNELYQLTPSRPEDRRTYTSLNLFSHFQLQHVGSQAPQYPSGRPPIQLDWKEDMIELPSDRFISGLIHATGMDDEKLLMIATVFPKLFPTPLPKIGVVDNNGVASPTHSNSKDSKDTLRTAGTPGVTAEKSGPSSLASPYADSPRPAKPSEDEYDPQHPAILGQGSSSIRSGTRLQAYAGSPPSDRRPRYYTEPRYYVGSLRDSNGQSVAANASLSQLPRDEYGRTLEYVELGPAQRVIRDSGAPYEDYPERRPMYRDPGYGPTEEDVIYAHPREGLHDEYDIVPHRVQYVDEEYGYLREPRPREQSSSRGRAEAERFLEEFVPGQPSGNKVTEQDPVQQSKTAGTDLDDGSRYTPPPPNAPPAEGPVEHSRSTTTHPPAPSVASNGSRYEDQRSGGRQVPTPDSTGPRRVGPTRRRDRHHDHIPSRYYRYMSVARDEPFHRGSSMSRSQSKRYERYNETRRRIDQQETPQPGSERDYDPAYSRDHSVDQGFPEDQYERVMRPAPRDYVPIQDRHHPYSPPRYRYAGQPEDSRGPAPIYVDEYGRPIHDEYEIIRVPRDPRHPRTPYSGPTRYYQDHGDDHVQYVSYDRPPSQRRPGEYVYYEERERPPLSARRPPESEATYEPPPPEIKVEPAAGPGPVPEGP